MRIAISASGKEKEALLDPRFGRCPFFAIYDTEKETWSALPNPGAMEGSGAGIKAAQFLVEQNVSLLLTGDVGPKASRVLQSSGIFVYSLPEVTLEEALQRYQEGNCTLVTGATVSSHAGLTDSRGAGEEIPSSHRKIAIATEQDEVAQHFGRCPSYTLVEIKEGSVADQALIPNPGHKPGFLPNFLAEQGVNCVIAGGMGGRAQNIFAEKGIKTIIGAAGPVEKVIENYFSGRLAQGESLCNHDQHGPHQGCEGHE